MRIGIDARMYGAEATTGIGAYIKNLTDQLFEIDRKNEYILLMLDPAYSKFQVPNDRVKKIKVKSGWYSWSEQFELPKVLLSQKLDLVHFPHFNIPIFYPKKFILTIHDITPKFYPGPNVKNSVIRKWGYKTVFRTGLKKAKKIISNSNYTKKNLIDFFKTPAQKIETIYLGVDQNFKVTSDPESLKKIKNKFQISKPFIFYVGVWRDHKNLPNLIKAFEITKSEYQLDYQLVLAGQPDPRYPEAKELIEKSNFKSDIILPGFIANNDLPLVYSAASLFILPSFCEGFGLVALESLACGTPVIVSNSTSLPEILADSAIYFNPHNPQEIAKVANQILTDQILYQKLKTRGLEQVKKYSWRKCAQETLAIYQSQ